MSDWVKSDISFYLIYFSHLLILNNTQLPLKLSANCVRKMSLESSAKLLLLELWNYYNMTRFRGEFSVMFHNHEKHIRDNLFFMPMITLLF